MDVLTSSMEVHDVWSLRLSPSRLHIDIKFLPPAVSKLLSFFSWQVSAVPKGFHHVIYVSQNLSNLRLIRRVKIINISNRSRRPMREQLNLASILMNGILSVQGTVPQCLYRQVEVEHWYHNQSLTPVRWQEPDSKQISPQ